MLRSHITQHVRLTFPQPDGSTLQAQLEKIKRDSEKGAIPASMQEALRKKADENAEVPINSYEHWLLSRFWELDSGRRQGPHGPESIVFSDITAYMEAFNEELEAIEVQILKAVDCAYLDAVFAEQRKQRDS